MDCHRQVDSHGLFLANAVNAIIALILNRRIPPPAEMDHMIGGSECEADSGRPRRKNEKTKTGGDAWNLSTISCRLAPGTSPLITAGPARSRNKTVAAAAKRRWKARSSMKTSAFSCCPLIHFKSC